MKQARQRTEHLVVELKRPKAKIGSDELTQIAKYATAVTSNARFNVREVEWDFWVVSDEGPGANRVGRRRASRRRGRGAFT
jgi:hypothetical protein